MRSRSVLPVAHSQASLPARLRLLFAALCAVCLVTAACYAQESTAPDPIKLVRDASYNELHSSGPGHPYRYRMHAVNDGKDTTKVVFETPMGDMNRLLELNGKPLDAEADAKERARLEQLRDHPDEVERKHKKDQADGERSNEMIRLLPDAFVYTYLGVVKGPSGQCYRLRFEPNPKFQPPDREAEVYHGMTGELWIDQAEQRIAKLDAHLISDVDFGWGVVGRLFKGGTILVEQRDVGDHHWETTREELHLSGKILLVKALHIDTNEVSSDFHPVPDDPYQAAIASLLKLPAS